MAHETFDNVNELELQAEAEIHLFENSNSGHTYTTMQGITFQPKLVKEQQFQPNFLQQFQTNILQQASTSTELNKTYLIFNIY